jgi:DNA-binding FrmR family transcriptional regulator
MPTAQQRRQILNRLKSVDGHLRGVIKMVEDDAYCMDVIKQLQAVQGAIDRVNALLLADHLQTCVTTAIRGDEPQERERVIGELLGLFEHRAHLPGTPAELVDAGVAHEAAPPVGTPQEEAR